MQRRFFVGCLTAGFAISLAPAAPAQSYPDRPIRLIAPFPAGGLADVLARAVGDQMTKSLGQPVVVENRAGAGGNTGALAVATAAPDGYTLLMSSAGILTANPFLYAKMPFDVETAFIPIANVAEMSMILVVNPQVEAKTLKDFVALAKARPGKLNFGSPGIGTTGHLGLAMFMHAAGVQITHVPYRGAAPAVQDLIAGQIDGVVDNPPTVIAHIESGKLRPLAVAAKSRMKLLPDVPTAAEGGVANYEASSWFGIAAPAGTPAPIVARLHKEIVAALRDPAMQERFAKSGARLVGNSPQEFAAQIRTERAQWGEIIKAAGITAE
ncbi:MAG TPA: tripartite tricarboxylate transporter substrate binding protein [Xanthobacteraceae bacterium]|nr:tripartite tricarboxylate transporter substrate binding protein [Xanthobacteraceae bacterium]